MYKINITLTWKWKIIIVLNSLNILKIKCIECNEN